MPLESPFGRVAAPEEVDSWPTWRTPPLLRWRNSPSSPRRSSRRST